MTAMRASSGMFARAAIVAIQCLAEWILTCGSPAAFSALHHWYRSVLEQTGLPRADVNTKSRMPMLFALIQPHNRFHNWVPIGTNRSAARVFGVVSHSVPVMCVASSQLGITTFSGLP